eukprot:5101363-Amphidinium_carterae.1
MTKDYCTSLLSLYSIKENTNSLSTTGTKQRPITTGEARNSEEHSTYRTIVGKLLWMCPLRPDIHYATKNKKTKQPTHSEPCIKAYCDSGWAGCSTTRKSTTGTALQFAGVTIATSSKHTTNNCTIISSSGTLRSWYNCQRCDLRQKLRFNFLHELNFTTDDKLIPQIYTESSSARCLTQQLGLTKRTKYIDMRYLHVQQLQSDGELKIRNVSTENNPSHLMTKYLDSMKQQKSTNTVKPLDYTPTLATNQPST